MMQEPQQEHLLQEMKRMEHLLRLKEQELEKLRVSHLFLETIFDGIHEEILVIDENFVVHNVNRTFLERHGVRKQEAVGRKCYEVTYKAEVPCTFSRQDCPLEKAKSTGNRIEVTHRHESGSEDFKEVIRIVYPVAEEGKTARYFLEISRDVTEYRKLIKTLQASERRLRGILDTATDAILSIDEKQRIILFNDAAERIFGYSRSEVLGKNLNTLIPAHYGDHSKFVKRFIETKTSKVMGKTLSLTALRKGGKEFPIEMGLSHQETEGDITVTAIIRDVTAQKNLEKKLLQSERLAAVGKTVAHVAHEIKNPLMIIGGFSQQIRRSMTEEKSIQKLHMILDEVGRLERLVADLGDFTKEYRLVKRPADINAVIRDVLNIMGEIYSGGKHGFEGDLAPNLEEIICDPDKLKQVFINTIANGLEAMEGGGTITIQTRKWDPHGVEIRITDRGVGMSEEELLHIFEPFYTTRESGSGLGLSISYRIVQAHKGEMWPVSRPGEGTTFIIRLPSN